MTVNLNKRGSFKGCLIPRKNPQFGGRNHQKIVVKKSRDFFGCFEDIYSGSMKYISFNLRIEILSCMNQGSAFGSDGPEPDRVEPGFRAAGTGLGLDVNRGPLV